MTPQVSLRKAIKNDTVVNSCAIGAGVAAGLLVLNLCFGLNFTRSQIVRGRDMLFAAIEIATIVIVVLIAALRLWYIRRLLKTGTQVTARVQGITRRWYRRYSVQVQVVFDLDGNTIETGITVEKSPAVARLCKAGTATLFVSKRNPRRAIIAELLAGILTDTPNREL